MGVVFSTGPLPLGYRYEAQKCSEATHEVPISGFDRAVDDYRQLFCDVEDFVSPGGGRDIPALFTSVCCCSCLSSSVGGALSRVLCLALCV